MYAKCYQTIRYKLVIILGPTKRPNQKIVFPTTLRPLSNLVLDKATIGNCISCIVNKYPLTFLNKTNMSSSCTQADNKNVTNVAVLLLSLNDEMLEL
jgi:hypothetical protein